MQKIHSALAELQEINRRYDISVEAIEQLQGEAEGAKVCTPIIGKFSSGKSALVNTVLGYCDKILKEDITPETAIPAEIIYTDGEESVEIVKIDGNCEIIDVDEYIDYEADANTVKCARIRLVNDFLKTIPDVMLVDMPGFESGFEVHNKAIDNYVSKSLAYIVAFPADDMIVKKSVGDILKELCLHEMPLCVVITKCDKRNDDFDATFTHLKEGLKRYIGEREIRYCMTSSSKGDARELKQFLQEIQEKSQVILEKGFSGKVRDIADNTENYLRTTLTGSQLSESELDEQEERLNKQLSALDSKFSKEQEDFESEMTDCVEEIKNDVQCAMEAEESTLVAMAMNNQNITEHLNKLIRNAVTVSVKKRFIPKVEKYLKRVTKTINSEEIGDINISFNYNAEKIDTNLTSSIVAVVAGLVLGFPIIGALAGIFMGIVQGMKGDQKREEAKQQIRMKLESEVFPQVLREVGRGIENTIKKEMQQVNTSIEEEIKIQRDTLEKAMADVRSQMNSEKAEKEQLENDISNDLERIGAIKDELR